MFIIAISVSVSLFRVANDNKHISVAEISNFFKSGYTSKSSIRRGIGLPKLKKMLTKHDGEIDFYCDSEIHKVLAQINHK